MNRDGWRLAIGTLTTLPVRAPVRVDRRVARDAMLLAPIAAIPLGALVAAVGAIASATGAGLVWAPVAIGALALGSRGLHLDGLADTADGLASSYDRDRALQVMRAGNVGPAGVTVLVLILIAQVTAVAAVFGRPWGWLLAGICVCLSRCALMLACMTGVPAARGDGLGAAVAGSVPRAAAGAGWLIAAGVLAACATPAGETWWQGVVAAAVAFALVVALVARCRTRLGGITGDTLGAGIELALAAMLIILAVW